MGVAVAEEEGAAAEVVGVAEEWDKRGLKGNLPVSPAIDLSCGKGGDSEGSEFFNFFTFFFFFFFLRN